MKIIFTSLVILLYATAINADNGIYSLTLKIRASQKEPIYIAIYKSESSFLKLDQATLKEKYPYNDNNQYVIAPLSEGDYALSIFQDINGNEKLDASFFGVPKEPYGFSNNAIGKFGTPSFTECKFSISKNMTMEITLK